MDLIRLIEKRRAYRSLDPVRITDQTVNDLASNAQLSPSCFNNQPWRYVFVYDRKKLAELSGALSKGNQWAHRASLIIAVVSTPEYDCRVRGREYYLFDTGMATAFMILRATDLGLIAHPIAGYDEEMVKRALKVPQELTEVCISLELKFLHHKCARKRACALLPPKPASGKAF